MTTINIYLTFEGECRAAFEFYKSIFGGEFQHIGTFGEIPSSDEMPAIPDKDKDKIMHVSLPISKETILMGSDTSSQFGPPVVKGNNFSISVSVDSRDKADQVFASLSEKGKVTMEMQDTFWNSYFGSCVDRFGIQWMVSFDLPEENS